MEKILESLEPKVREMESIIQQYGIRTAQALEVENKKLKERAEQDSSQIIARAREEADKIIAQARQEAKVESDKMKAKLKEEAEQTARESREKASAKVRQESARIISEAREKTAQIITELIERGITQAKSEFVRAASEARSRLESETSQLLTVTKSIEQIIDETETNIQAGFEHLATVIAEAGRKLQLVNEIPDRETMIGSRQVAEEAGKTEHTEKLEKQEIDIQAGFKHLATVIIEDEKKLQPVDEIPHRETVIGSRQVAEEAGKTEHTEKLEKQEIDIQAGEEARLKTEEVKKTEGSDDADIQIQEGTALSRLGKNEEALEAFMKVIELDPKNAIAWRKKGTTLGRLGRHEEALEAFVKAIELTPKDINAWSNKVTALTILGRKKEAEEAKAAEKRAKKEAERAAKEKTRKYA